ncbi:hypothetical protein [Rubrivirga sp.]|uniref:hypothetical protein n=1 Tax=Rubrivirga sp. TaxID=1885344 RepID=UPI003C743779
MKVIGLRLVSRDGHDDAGHVRADLEAAAFHLVGAVTRHPRGGWLVSLEVEPDVDLDALGRALEDAGYRAAFG